KPAANRGARWVLFGNAGFGLGQETSQRLRAVTPVLLDTGVVVALLDRSERYHSACVECLQELAPSARRCGRDSGEHRVGSISDRHPSLALCTATAADLPQIPRPGSRSGRRLP